MYVSIVEKQAGAELCQAQTRLGWSARQVKLDAYKLQNKLSQVVGGGWVLDQVRIRLTQPQVELELGLSLAKIHVFLSCKTHY